VFRNLPGLVPDAKLAGAPAIGGGAIWRFCLVP